MKRLQGIDEALAEADKDVLEAAMWAGDVNRLCELAPCTCCCSEHTFDWCDARQWGGCRGQGSMTRDDVESWFRFYRDTRGFSHEQFFGYEL